MVAEMNKMNELIDQMKAQLAAYEREAKGADGKDGDGAAAAGEAEGDGGIGGLSDRTWSVAVTMPTQIRHTVRDAARFHATCILSAAYQPRALALAFILTLIFTLTPG